MLAACVGPQQPFDYKGKPTIRVARAAMSSGSPEIALNVAGSILASKPYDVPALVMKGDALYALGLFQLSQSSYLEVLKIQSASPAAHLGLGRIKLSDHDPRAAEAEFRTALRGETLPETISDLGVALDLQQRPVEAQAEYRRALQIDPGSAATRVNLARSLLATGDVEGARTALQPVLSGPTNSLSPDVANVQRAIEQQSAGAPVAAPSVAPSATPSSALPAAPDPVRLDATSPPRTRPPRVVQ